MAVLGGGAHLLPMVIGARGGSEPDKMTQGRCDFGLTLALPSPSFQKVQFINHLERKDGQLDWLLANYPWILNH